jgi:hypothetical protein
MNSLGKMIDTGFYSTVQKNPEAEEDLGKQNVYM